jgi:hypothetical protein
VHFYRGYIDGGAQCGINFGEVGTAGPGFTVANTIIKSWGQFPRKLDFKGAGILIGGGDKGLPHNLGNVVLYNNTIVKNAATVGTNDENSEILIQDYNMDSIKIKNNLVYAEGSQSIVDVPVRIEITSGRISTGVREYENNDIYRASGNVVFDGATTWPFDNIAGFNGRAYASGNVVEDPLFTDYDGDDFSLTGSSSATMKTGGIDVCDGVYAGCEFNVGIHPSRNFTLANHDWLTANHNDSCDTPPCFPIGAIPFIAGNQAPTATIDLPTGDTTTINEGETVDFSGSATDPENDTLTYFWDFFGQGAEGATVADPTATTYPTAGTYTVTFRATDTSNNSSTDNHTVQVDAAGGGGWIAANISNNLNIPSTITQDIATREKFEDGDLVDATTAYSKIRVTFRAEDDGALEIDGASVCLAALAGDAYDCTSTPIRLTFSGSNTVNITQDTTLVSDGVDFAWDGTATILVHVWLDGGSRRVRRDDTPTTVSYFKTGGSLSDETLTADVTGYTSSTVRAHIVGIDGFEGAGGGGSTPVLQRITITTADGSYKEGDVITGWEAVWSESVTVTGTPQLNLSSNGVLDFASGSPGAESSFDDYTVGAGDVNVADLTVATLTLNGGTIKATDDSNDANLLVPGSTNVGDLHNITIDTVAPTVSAIGFWEDGTETCNPTKTTSVIAPGETIQLCVEMDETLDIPTANPESSTLTVVCGPGTATASAIYEKVSSDGTILVYTYTALARHRSTDLQTATAATALVLNNAILTDLAGNSLTTTLPGTDLGSITVAVPGTFTIGAGGDYATLTAMQAATYELAGDQIRIIANVTDDFLLGASNLSQVLSPTMDQIIQLQTIARLAKCL